jgi:Na+-translocating ferredoxin:NAD+ oxidoreductase RnfE subunit
MFYDIYITVCLISIACFVVGRGQSWAQSQQQKARQYRRRYTVCFKGMVLWEFCVWSSVLYIKTNINYTRTVNICFTTYITVCLISIACFVVGRGQSWVQSQQQKARQYRRRYTVCFKEIFIMGVLCFF